MYVCMCACMCVYVCMCMCVYVCMCVCVCICMSMCVRVAVVVHYHFEKILEDRVDLHNLLVDEWLDCVPRALMVPLALEEALDTSHAHVLGCHLVKRVAVRPRDQVRSTMHTSRR